MRIERIDVAQNLPGIFKLIGTEHFAAHHETDGTPGVHHVAADAATQVFVPCNGAQHFTGHGVGHIAGEHLGTDFFQVNVNVFERVGRVLGVGVKQLEQDFLSVFDQAKSAARTHAQQPEHRHIFVVNRKQHALAFEIAVDQVQDEGHTHRARLVHVGDQKVRADVQLAVVLFVKTCGLLDVLVHHVFRNRQAVVLLDPAFFFQRGRLEVDPDRLKLGELLQGFNFFLEQPPVDEREYIEHGALPCVFKGRRARAGLIQACAGRGVVDGASLSTPQRSFLGCGIES